MIKNCKISGFSDEISPVTDEQFSHIKTLNISYFEPRGVDGKNISSLSNEECKILKEKMEENHIKVSQIGSPIGKIKIKDSFEDHFEVFKRQCEIAHKLDADRIRMFSFFMPENEDPSIYKNEVIEKLSKMVEYAESEKIILAHENEKGIYGDIALRCLDLFKAIKSDYFTCVFDPANFVQCNQDTLEAYEMLEEYITYMHIKDALSDGNVVPAGMGVGNVKEILTRLDKKGYEGFLSLEPHLGNFDGLANLELDDKMLSLEKSDAGKFTIAYNALLNIINKIGA